MRPCLRAFPSGGPLLHAHGVIDASFGIDTRTLIAHGGEGNTHATDRSPGPATFPSFPADAERNPLRPVETSGAPRPGTPLDELRLCAQTRPELVLATVVGPDI